MQQLKVTDKVFKRAVNNNYSEVAVKYINSIYVPAQSYQGI